MNFNVAKWYLALGVSYVTTPFMLAAESPSSFVPKKIISGALHNCVLSTSGQVKCWGNNDEAALGSGSRTPMGKLPNSMGSNLPLVDLGKNIVVKDMCAGWGFSCAATTTGRVKCWGTNTSGQLGQELPNNLVGYRANEMGDNLPWTNLGTGFVATDVQCGYHSACALNNKGQVKCWGDNVANQLGRKIPGRNDLGKRVGDMGDHLPYLSLPPVTSLSFGEVHGCAKTESAVYCWGSNHYGQAGMESSANITELPPNVTDLRSVKLEDPGTATTIHSVTAGDYHSCATYSTGMPSKKKTKCWGFNANGQLGIGSADEGKGRLPGTMGSKLPELQLDANNFMQIENYRAYSCALKQNGATLCWGLNDIGQLGLGDLVDRGKKPEDLGVYLKPVDLGLPVIALSHGAISSSTCALLINHEVKCWGRGDYGQLGYEDDLSRGDVPSDMGDNLPFVRYK